MTVAEWCATVATCSCCVVPWIVGLGSALALLLALTPREPRR